VVLGRPDPAFYGAGVEALGQEPDRVVMVGDNVRSAVEGAQGRSGAHRKVLAGRPVSCDVSPHAVLDAIADLPRWWAQP
jgi:FMN phosphatase YigB (HAD superfamily)